MVDILFLRKRKAGEAAGAAVARSCRGPCRPSAARRRFPMNRYFARASRMALGMHARTSGAYGPGLY